MMTMTSPGASRALECDPCGTVEAGACVWCLEAAALAARADRPRPKVRGPLPLEGGATS